MTDNILEIETLHQFNTLIGQRTLHPLVSVIDVSEAKTFKSITVSGNFYALFFKQVECGSFKYGRRCHDFQAGTLVFTPPEQVVDIEMKDVPGQTDMVGILFHPQVFKESSLCCKKSEYTFFTYQENESLHLSEQEKKIVQECMYNLKKELKRDIDKFSLRLVTVHLELLLDYCLRFYERQFIIRNEVNKSILTRFDQLLETFFQSERILKTETDSITFAHENIPHSLAYLNDLVKVESGKTLQEYARLKRIDVAKELILNTNKPAREIASQLGFTDSRSFLCLFKKITGYTPDEYRQKWGCKPN